MGRESLWLLVLSILFNVFIAQAQGQRGIFTFNVLRYGAMGDGKTDNSKAFLRAWTDACKWRGRSRVIVPRGTYMLAPVVFSGPCQGPIHFRVQGLLKAYEGKLDVWTWINFRYIDRLHINGGGTIDGQGGVAWSLNNCHRNPGCRRLPVSLGLDFVTNSRIRGLTSINSKDTHLNVFMCTNLSITNMVITAPAESPNTDGIRMGLSSSISLTFLRIGTGDDSVALLPGSKDISISQVTCGPGHGISVGSMGRNKGEDSVTGLRVTNCTFVGSDNGLRIKTWAASQSTSVVRDMIFENIEMRRVANPIIIDQHYCPHPPCLQQSPSQVRISDILFKNIWGTSTTKTALFIRCSPRVPCQKINFHGINLWYDGKGGGPAISECSHAIGSASGFLVPRPCV